MRPNRGLKSNTGTLIGAILVAADHQTVLLEQGNIDSVSHAESTVLANTLINQKGPWVFL